MNNIEIISNITWEDSNEQSITRDFILCAGDYQPGNMDSMYNAINKITDDLIKIRELVGDKSISGIRIRTRRQDGTIIDEIVANYFENAKQVIEFMCMI